MRRNYTSYWGRGLGVQNMLGTYMEIPVQVDAVNFGQPGVIPRQVVVTINYYQVDEVVKRLVSASVSYPLEYQCVSLTSGGLVQESLLASGIPQCVQDVDGATASSEYLLEIYYISLPWGNLFNAFQFTAAIFMIFFLATGILTVVVGFFVWGMQRLLTKLRHPPPFHGMSLFVTIAQPAVFGVCLSGAPLMFAVLFLWWFFMSGNSGGVICQPTPLTAAVMPLGGLLCMQDLTDWQAADDPEAVTRPGRQQLAIFFVGAYATVVFARLVLPKYSDTDRLPDVQRKALLNKKEDKKAAAIAAAALPGNGARLDFCIVLSLSLLLTPVCGEI